MSKSLNNVINDYFDHYDYFDRATVDFSSTMTAIARSTISYVYYMTCFETRFYDYLASSEVRNELSSKLVTNTLVS
jgi:hypothetical protein